MTSLQSQPRAIEPRDETPHEHGGEPGWSERLAFNFFDVSSGAGGVATLEYLPGERRGTGEVDLFLPSGAVATALARAHDVKRAEHAVGRISFTCDEQMKRWTIRCTDIALLFPNAESATLSAQTERAGKAAQIQLELTFDAWSDAAGWAARRTDVDEMKFAKIVSLGWFEQPGTIRGTMRVGTNEMPFDGSGFRERAWGRIEAAREDRWFVAAFGPDLSLSVGRITIDGEAAEHSRIFHGSRISHARAGDAHISDGEFSLPIAEEHARHELTGRILATIPPRDDAAKVYRSMTRFRLGAREALGLVETRALFL